MVKLLQSKHHKMTFEKISNIKMIIMIVQHLRTVDSFHNKVCGLSKEIFYVEFIR